MAEYCMTCGNEVSNDEIGINKKLIDENVEVYQCLSCLSLEMGIPEDELLKKIEEFKKEGCVLFK